MYLSRTNSLLDIALYLVLTMIWVPGAWLLVRYSFHLRRAERFISALAVGFLLFIGISNLLAHFLDLSLAFWAASILILLAGVISAWRSGQRPWFGKRFGASFPLLIGLAVFTVLFTLILRGQSIFDEYVHLPLISIIAAGDIPPHFYLNPDFYFAYHYGIQVYAASLVRLADFFPWSAWDVSRAIAFAFTLVLGWIWVRRITRSRLAAWVGSFLFTFGGGARWLLLLLPASWLSWVSHSVNLIGTGLDTAPTLAEAIHKSWVIEGGGPLLYPFAFHNGIFVPVSFTLGSTGAMPFMTVLLLLLLLPPKRFSALGLVVWSLLLATLALSAEHLFAVIWVGIALAMTISIIFHKRFYTSFPKDRIVQWVIVLCLGALVALVQGGFITETARNLVASISGSAARSYNARGFSLRWPPGLLSAHLGNLSILNPAQLVALLAELGPALLLIPVIFIRFKKQLIGSDWLAAGLALSVPLSLVFPLFLKYEVDRSITRMPATALWTCLVLGFPLLWMSFRHQKLISRFVMLLGYAVIVLAGVVIFRTQLYSIKNVEYSYYIDGLDARFTAAYWNKLPRDAQVLDSIPERSVTIFGRISRAYSGIYAPLPEWQALVADPNPSRAAAAGYDYIYMDPEWWESLTLAQQVDFQQPCIDIIDERKQDSGTDYRLLVDIRGCR